MREEIEEKQITEGLLSPISKQEARMKNPLVLEYLEKAKQKFRKTS